MYGGVCRGVVNASKRGHTLTGKRGQTCKCGRPWFPVMPRRLKIASHKNTFKMGLPLEGYGHVNYWIVIVRCV